MTSPALSRRQVLAGAAGAAAAGLLASCSSGSSGGGARVVEATGPATTSPAATSAAPTAAATTSAATTAAPAPVAGERVLVVVNLYGGNDGLNTLVPLDGRYHDARPTIGLKDDTLVPFPGTERYGLHPALAPLRGLLGAGRVSAVQSVGYPRPNRSHFAAQDDWASSTPGQASTTGWLGRWLDTLGPGGDHPLRAVALSGGAPMLAGATGRPTVVLNPSAFSFKAPRASDLVRRWAVTGGGGLEAAVRDANASAAASVAVFERLAAQADHDAGGDEPVSGQFAKALETAARVATSGEGVRVVHVAAGGFDTHAAQLETQQRLLGDLADGIVRFQQVVDRAGAADRVLLMTVSEFGRRVHDNGGGTDHGKAGVQFLVGPAVQPGVHGDVDLADLDDGDLRAATDVRAVYATVLDWLGADVQRVLGRSWEDLGLLRR